MGAKPPLKNPLRVRGMVGGIVKVKLGDKSKDFFDIEVTYVRGPNMPPEIMLLRLSPEEAGLFRHLLNQTNLPDPPAAEVIPTTRH